MRTPYSVRSGEGVKRLSHGPIQTSMYYFHRLKDGPLKMLFNDL